MHYYIGNNGQSVGIIIMLMVIIGIQSNYNYSATPRMDDHAQSIIVDPVPELHERMEVDQRTAISRTVFSFDNSVEMPMYGVLLAVRSCY